MKTSPAELVNQALSLLEEQGKIEGPDKIRLVEELANVVVYVMTEKRPLISEVLEIVRPHYDVWPSVDFFLFPDGEGGGFYLGGKRVSTEPFTGKPRESNARAPEPDAPEPLPYVRPKGRKRRK